MTRKKDDLAKKRIRRSSLIHHRACERTSAAEMNGEIAPNGCPPCWRHLPTCHHHAFFGETMAGEGQNCVESA